MGTHIMDSPASTGFERRPRVLLAISAEPAADLREAVAPGREPRRDYFALQGAPAAALLTPFPAAPPPMLRLLIPSAGLTAPLVSAAFFPRRPEHSQLTA